MQETFSIQDGRFEEDEHYFVDEEVGSGTSGVVYKAHTSKDPSIQFCIKKVSQPNGASTFHSKGRNARLLFRGKEVAVLG